MFHQHSRRFHLLASRSTAALCRCELPAAQPLSATSSSFFYRHNAPQDVGPRRWLRYSAQPPLQPKDILPIPPNLKFDPRSSFAPGSLDGNKKRKQQKQQQQENTNSPHKAAATAKISHSEQRNEDYESNQDYDPEEYENDEDNDAQEDKVLFMRVNEVRYTIPLPDRLKVDVHTFFAPKESSHTGTLILDETVFGKDPTRIDLLKRAVDYIRARKRGYRKAKMKTLSEVSGSGKKMRKQKGTGQARAGHKRPPHWRGGGNSKGPRGETNYARMKLNKKVRRLAVRHALSQKLKEGNLLVVNHMHELPTHKTKELYQLLEPWGFGVKDGATAILMDHYHPEEIDDEDKGVPKPAATTYYGVPVNLHVASGNLPRLIVGNTHICNVYNLLKYEKLILTVSALQWLESKLTENKKWTMK